MSHCIMISGSRCQLPVEEGRHRVHPPDGHHRGRGDLEHQDLHHPQDHGAQVQGVYLVKSKYSKAENISSTSNFPLLSLMLML